MTLTNEVELVEKSPPDQPNLPPFPDMENQQDANGWIYTALADTANTITALSEGVDGGSY